MTVSIKVTENLHLISNSTNTDPPSPSQRSLYGDEGLDEDEGYRLDPEDDSSVMFDIPEETLLRDENLGSDLDDLDDLLDDLDEDHGFSDPDGLESEQSSHEPFYSGHEYGRNVPNIILQLQSQLLNEYTLPPCPNMQILSLQHYLAWVESHGTVKAYNAHAKVLAMVAKEEILSLYKVRKLVLDLTGLTEYFLDMCPKSCMAFTGEFKAQSTCSYKNAWNHAIGQHRVLGVNQSHEQPCSTCP